MNSNLDATPDAVPNMMEPSWAALVERLRTGDPSGMEELYRVFSQGIRFYFYRHLGAHDLDDKVHDAFLIITQAIQRGELREPDRLMGYVRTIVRRQIAGHIGTAIQNRQRQTDLDHCLPVADLGPTPERRMIEQENFELAMRILNSLNRRDREVLTRFYLQEQGQEQICREMDLTDTQFRLVKSRAKARFGELGKTRLARKKGFRS
jgi:RNA polymerase sigma-70 factor, ECF subfamily